MLNEVNFPSVHSYNVCKRKCPFQMDANICVLRYMFTKHITITEFGQQFWLRCRKKNACVLSRSAITNGCRIFGVYRLLQDRPFTQPIAFETLSSYIAGHNGRSP